MIKEIKNKVIKSQEMGQIETLEHLAIKRWGEEWNSSNRIKVYRVNKDMPSAQDVINSIELMENC